MTLTIRPGTQADIAAVDALLARAYPRLLKVDYPPSVLVTALPLISRANPRLITCGTYFLAESAAGALLGAGGWTAARPGSGKTEAALCHVRHVVTDDRAVRRGVGRAVMARVIGTARAAGMRRIECYSTRTAVPFYVAMGFGRGQSILVQLAPGIEFPAVCMTLDLAS